MEMGTGTCMGMILKVGSAVGTAFYRNLPVYTRPPTSFAAVLFPGYL